MKKKLFYLFTGFIAIFFQVAGFLGLVGLAFTYDSCSSEGICLDALIPVLLITFTPFIGALVIYLKYKNFRNSVIFLATILTIEILPFLLSGNLDTLVGIISTPFN